MAGLRAAAPSSRGGIARLASVVRYTLQDRVRQRRFLPALRVLPDADDHQVARRDDVDTLLGATVEVEDAGRSERGLPILALMLVVGDPDAQPVRRLGGRRLQHLADVIRRDDRLAVVLPLM